MKIMRIQHGVDIFYAALEGDRVRRIAGSPYGDISFSTKEYALCDVSVLTPCEPTKIVAVGLNYAKHAGEMNERLVGNPILFIKPTTSAIADGGHIHYPAASSRVDYEAELAVVIKKRCRNVGVHEALAYILGYTPLNDVTARDIQAADGQWTRGKSFDTFCPFGPYIDTDYDPKGKRIQCVLNGEIKQDAVIDDMLFGVAELVAFISECMTLLPGDVIATGTPEGIGPMQRGDTVEVRIEGLAPLKNRVV
jgi:2-keto-4-pentenoate hydratase/2-oxohepta-3-ene-1,7-dioic acid hydratase in catechol pathway